MEVMIRKPRMWLTCRAALSIDAALHSWRVAKPRCKTVGHARPCLSLSSWPKTALRPGLDDGGMQMVASESIECDGNLLFSISGVLQRHPSLYSIQIDKESHLVSVAETSAREEGMVGAQLHAYISANADEHPWAFLDHSFDPTVRLELLDDSESTAALGAYAITNMPAGTPITFDYTLHEWYMRHPFRCKDTGRWVSGFGGLTEQEMEAALPFAARHIQQLHAQWLFGQHSRC